ncbi:hypothetical protein OS242_08015 [Tumebacillus sp. DT12]|uniref:DUF4358 domain-containing protein n=1 Tax=Tumebacillus lacus TaxID=2995335 RepID=A0ABT3WZ25_9BACL|nr:hypothetical protein [Tumebacillus lacus]MCX7569908.1 hypothetical protein [Tumebacillus lacus]
MRVFRWTKQMVLLLCCAMLFAGCSVGTASPIYTKETIVTTLKEYGVLAHYPVSQGNGRLLLKAKGERHFLQIDYFDHYRLDDVWVEVYLYPSDTEAYEDSLALRKMFEERFRHDEKIARLQGKTLERSPLPLFQHGNLILFSPGIGADEEMMKRITDTFGKIRYE